MSRKIATPAAVFAACEALEEAGKPWNRDDVRYSVGGGGYNVIDPLIQTWRKIKPIKAIAPNTPTDLIHVIVESIESHIFEYTNEVENRDRERAKAFEMSALNLSDKIAELEKMVQQYDIQLTESENENQQQQGRIETLSKTARDLNQSMIKQQTENDELRGSIQRIETQLQDEKADHLAEIEHLQINHKEKVNALLKEQDQKLSLQKRDLIKSNEQSENRLMRILQQERSSSEKSIKEIQKKLEDTIREHADIKVKNTTQADKIKRLEMEVQALKEAKNQKDEMGQLTSTLKELTEKIGELDRLEN